MFLQFIQKLRKYGQGLQLNGMGLAYHAWELKKKKPENTYEVYL